MIRLKNILIFATARSGSSALMRLLLSAADKYPEKFSGFEPFSPVKINRYKSDDVEVTTNGLIRRVYLIKHLASHLTPDQNRKIVQAENVKNIVFLYRRSLFDQAVSRRVAYWKKEWFTPKQPNPIALPPDEINMQIQYFFYANSHNSKMISDSKKPFFVVAYEDLFNLNQKVRRKTIAELYGFLDIPYRMVKPAMEATSPKNRDKNQSYYENIVYNYEALKELYGKWNSVYNNQQYRPESKVNA